MGARSELVERLLSVAQQHGGRPAVVTGEATHSYEELYACAGTLAGRLTGIGDPGDRCAVLGRRSFVAYAAFVGCLLAERVYLPLSPHDPPQRMATTLQRGRCRTLIADRASIATAVAVATASNDLRHLIVPDLTRGEISGLGTPPGVSIICADDLLSAGLPAATRTQPEAAGAYLIFTSGSTGTPKGVLVPFGAVASYLAAMRPLLAVGADDRVSQVFDAGFDLSVHDMVLTWDAGAALCPLPETSRFRPGEAIRDLGLSVWFSVPSTISVMAGLGQLRPDLLRGLRTSLFCGEALRTVDIAGWRAAAPQSRLLNLYGPTEATIAASAHVVSASDIGHATVPIGDALPGVRYVLLEPDHDRWVEPTVGNEGELGIVGQQLAIGYWDDPALTEHRFPTLATSDGRERVYRTGDRVRRLADGGYLYLGRLDNEIKIAGAYRLNLLEIEEAVANAAQALACAVVVTDGRSQARSRLTAFLVDTPCSDRTIRERLRQSHPAYMIPEGFRRLPFLPTLANGKVDRRALSSLAAASADDRVPAC